MGGACLLHLLFTALRCYYVGMKRTHIFLPQPVIDRLKNVSAQTGLSVAEIIRRAIDDYLRSNCEAVGYEKTKSRT